MNCVAALYKASWFEDELWRTVCKEKGLHLGSPFLIAVPAAGLAPETAVRDRAASLAASESG